VWLADAILLPVVICGKSRDSFEQGKASAGSPAAGVVERTEADIGELRDPDGQELQIGSGAESG